MKFALVLAVLAVAVTASSAQQFAHFGWNRYYGAYPAGYGFAAPYFAAPYFAARPATAAAISYEPEAEFIPAAAVPATPAIVPAAPVAPFAGNYVAANRGSVHAAPLDGHTQSVRSFNTDPAPGTY